MTVSHKLLLQKLYHHGIRRSANKLLEKLPCFSQSICNGAKLQVFFKIYQYKWCCTNELQINPEKSEAIIMPSKLSATKTDLSITYNDSPINCMITSKYLGVKLDFKLNCKYDITLVENKAARLIKILSKLCILFPSSTLLLLCYLFIHPNLLFGVPLLGNTNPTYLAKLITNSEKRALINPHHIKLGISKLYTRTL